MLLPDFIISMLDSAVLQADTIPVDSARISLLDSTSTQLDTMLAERAGKYSIFIDLFMFQEDNTPQYLSDYNRPDPRKLEFYFNKPLVGKFTANPLNFDAGEDWFIREDFIVGDTLVYWIRDSIVYNLDTLTFRLNYMITDSVLNYYPYDDTVTMLYSSQETTGRRRQARQEEEEEEEKEFLGLNLNVKNRATMEMNAAIRITPGHPVAFADPSKISLFYKEDTVEIMENFSFLKDTNYLRSYILGVNWEEGMSYRLFIEPGAFTDIYELTNDTTIVSFTTRSLEYYGKIILALTNVSENLVVQLMSTEQKILSEKSIETDGTIEFPFLAPSNYKLKVIFDANRNGIWDTGDYLNGIQPEWVEYYSGEINVRSNWDMEVNWRLKD